VAKQPKPFTAREVAIANPIIKLMSRANAWVYRLSGGRLGGTWMYGAPVMLLTVTGRKSGRKYTKPLLYLRDGEKVICVASKGGMDHHPLWYRNLETHPDVEVQIGSEVRAMRAATASDAERAAYWPRLVAMYPDFDDYQARTARRIPVIVLTPR
jgi:deazaflavin-dependent oxidoreductase (nitroreductase family)